MALLLLVTLFAIALLSTTVIVVHLAYSVVVATVLAFGAYEQGTDPWLLASRCCTVFALLSAPLVVVVYANQIVRRLDKAQVDPQTRLLNWLGLENAVAVAADDPTAGNALLTVSVSIDDYTSAARRFGYAAQQDAVSDTMNRVRGTFEPDSILARVAPDEFVVCRWLATSDDTPSVVRETEDRLSRGPLRDSSVSVTCGVAVINRSAEASGSDGNEWTVLRGLDSARLRRASIVPSEGFGLPHEEASSIAGRIEAVIAGGGPDMVFQPIFTSDLEVAGFEALARFPGSEATTEQWFADADAAGLSGMLETAAIDRALRCSADLPAASFLAVNVSATTLLIGDVPDTLVRAARTRRLVIELTERDDVALYPSLTAVLERLRDNGVEIALDDVGAGWAGLRQLVTLEPDVVKLDAFIVHDALGDTTKTAAAEAITSFVRRTGARSVFEGIETEDDLLAARAAGADLLQGFYLGKPAAVGAVVDEPGVIAGRHSGLRS